MSIDNDNYHYVNAFEEEYKCSIKSILDCVVIFSAIRDDNGHIIDFRVEYVNDEACSFNQMTREEHLGKTLLEIRPAYKEDGLFNEYCKFVDKGEPVIKRNFTYEDIFGKRRLSKAVDIRAVKLKDGYAVIWCNTTKYHNSERALQESKEVPNKMATLGYEACKIMIEAIKKCGGINSQAVADALKTTDITSVTGHIMFDENRDAIKPGYIFEIEKGKQVFVAKVTP